MKTRFLHVRPTSEDKKPTPRGGFTVAYVIDDVDQVGHWAFARCSTKDNFCKATGRVVAGGRLASKTKSRHIIPCSEKAFIASVTGFLTNGK